ncbi:MAG: hypothetical protein IJ530_03050 [Treponema sp.]|uniref:hypothetical protein n=1 Tax=unclassified Treponema TaxID=2638727 RepID=UPI0025EC69A0|nr:MULTISPECIES: hypothetical protein [unclassified Treponema]MBQ8678720.1 hypothetical protein [Treponema sp.]
MSFALLEKQVQSLPQELQNSIEMYALFVINQFKNASKKNEKKRSASEIIENLTGILEEHAPLTMKEVRAERLKERYGV